jgi:hypothetical protein
MARQEGEVLVEGITVSEVAVRFGPRQPDNVAPPAPTPPTRAASFAPADADDHSESVERMVGREIQKHL